MDEFDIISKYVPSPSPNDLLVLGRGDDCSVVDFDQTHYLVQTTDNFVEDIHFRRRHLTPEEVAYKSLAVNISDILAMGATARWCHLSMAVPADIDEPWLKRFFETFNATVEKEDLQLVGGDLSKSGSQLFINVHVSGLVLKDQIKWRSKLGDASTLFVTGFLGDSSAGFKALEDGDKQNDLIDKHKRPPILTEVSHWLAGRAEVLGMMDLSDGLLSDLKRIPSGQIEIFMEKIPHSDELKNYCELKEEDPFKFSLGGGEDYELLLSCQAEKASILSRDFEKEFGAPLFLVGKVKPGSKSITYLYEGKEKELKFSSFNHFG